ncbi:glucose-6-phosphate dehydrogenase [Simplicispira psychrophila]|uniref:glucose-6-phosphate dehydrogenase n=1 Tax=Simplicispira psychrophila TaxID=80882 RepID=UPI00056CCF6A|nr:glucose-6-phosphate dehydrogenase [Simplicispira psychrophila]
MAEHSPHSPPAHSDALVIFGISGDLAFKKIFPALYAMVKNGALSVPVIGVAASDWTREQLHQQARKSLQEETGMDDPAVCERLLALLFYVHGDYRAAETFSAIKAALKNAQRPAYYLAIPPSLFTVVIQGLQSAGLTEQARIIVEKPFGRDLASAQELSRIAQSAFAENAIFRIDHYLGKEALMNLLYFRFANSFFEPLWNRDNIASVEITLAESFGIEERGAFYETAGCLRDVVENHMLQIVALLAMEPPAFQGFKAVQQAKANVFYAMRALVPGDLVRGQYIGYRNEPHVASDSDVETFCALRLWIDSWRWHGVPWFLRSGKKLANTAAEVRVHLKPPPQRLFDDADAHRTQANYVRFRLSPDPAIALATRVKCAGESFVGQQRELYLSEISLGHDLPYERLLGDAMEGDATLFSNQEAVEAAWAVVNPVLTDHAPALPYPPGSWGPPEADALIAACGGWHNPEAPAPAPAPAPPPPRATP